ncbi:MerR family transcriptional regulator [Paenibacillus puerhi]|uniref:MerR family transcriptional regulator n=1 Tax=Paenibacillus puerhi TaxID=2692622 RepID=UPI00135837EF|nr:MerR family transcriptional regulator [Paenibacillus puerhi]
MKVKEVADLVGISVRTLHHYDEIGLLVPDGTTEAGYRVYSDDNLELLQQILFYRELGFSLKSIKAIVNSAGFDRQKALEMHRSMLLEKRRRLDDILATVEQTIRHTKGEISMTNQEKFKGFDFSHHPYEEEARQRWGDEAVDRSKGKLAAKPGQEQEALGEAMNDIYRKLAELRHGSPAAEEAQAAIGEWYAFLNTLGSYTPEAFRGLGHMYVDDERFTANIDKFGTGLAMFMKEAMEVFADRQIR